MENGIPFTPSESFLLQKEKIDFQGLLYKLRTVIHTVGTGDRLLVIHIQKYTRPVCPQLSLNQIGNGKSDLPLPIGYRCGNKSAAGQLIIVFLIYKLLWQIFILVQMQNLVNAQKCHISGTTSQTVRHPSLTVNRTSIPANPNP